MREDQLVELIRVLLADSGAAATATLPPRQLADHLRQQGLVVTCGEAGCSLDPAALV